MNKRQKKKRFKQIHGMNPKEYASFAKRVKVIRELIAYREKMNEGHNARRNLLKHLTEQRKAGLRKKGKWNK